MLRLGVIAISIAGLVFGLSRVFDSVSPTSTTLPPLELNLNEDEQAFDFRRIGITRNISLDADFTTSAILVSKLELLPPEIQEASNLVNFDDEVLIGVGSEETCSHKPVQEKMIITFQDEQDFVFDARLVDDCTDRLDVFISFLVFTTVNREDLSPEFLAELDSAEEFIAPSVWDSVNHE